MLVPATAAADVANACALLSPVEIQEITGRSDLATGKPDLRPWRK
jgi:hypothetical protein